MSDLTGARAVYVMLRDAGSRGVHSREIIASRCPGATNPSERLREIANHVPIRKRSERHGRSPGVRAWLPEFAPDDAIPVTPASPTHPVDDGLSCDSERGGEVDPRPTVASGSITPPDEQVGLTEPVAIFRDFTRPDGRWMEVPVSELDLGAA